MYFYLYLHVYLNVYVYLYVGCRPGTDIPFTGVKLDHARAKEIPVIDEAALYKLIIRWPQLPHFYHSASSRSVSLGIVLE